MTCEDDVISNHIVLLLEVTVSREVPSTSNVLVDRLAGCLGVLPEQEAFVDDVAYRCAVILEFAHYDVELIGGFAFRVCKRLVDFDRIDADCC